MHTYLKYIAIVSIVLASFSCKKVLEPTPENLIAPENFFKALPDLEATVIGAYDWIQGFDGLNPAGNVHSGAYIVLRGEINSDMYLQGPNTTFQNHLNGNTNQNPFASYRDNFRVLNTANNAITYGAAIKVTPAEEARKKHLLAEAKFLRAWTLFDLLRNWRNIALITKPTENYNDVLPTKQYMYEQGVNNRASKEFEVIWQVLHDLEEAAPDLFVSYTSAGIDINTRGRATRGAAHAMLARVYLWRATYENKALTADSVNFCYRQVLQWADSVDNPAKKVLYDLLPGDLYANIFTSKNTKESIWEIQYSGLTIENQSLRGIFLPQTTGLASYGGQFSLRLNQATRFVGPFNTATGLLNNSTSATPMSWLEYQALHRDTYMDGYYKSSSDPLAPDILVKDLRKNASIGYSNFFFSPVPNTLNPDINTNSRNFWYLNKYPGTSNASGRYDSDDNIKMIRLSEVILMKAEAYNALGDVANARIHLGRIKTRAGIPQQFWLQEDAGKKPQENMLESILDERLLEFVGEGVRWYDLVRTNRIAIEMEEANLGVRVNSPVKIERLNTIPIQRDRIIQYNLTQNPGH